MHTCTPFRLAAAVVFGLTGPLAAQDDPVTADTVVATVNGTELTLGHMIALKTRLPEQYQTIDAPTLFEGILDQIVQQTVLAGEGGDLTRESTLLLENEARSLLAGQIVARKIDEAITDEAIEAAYAETYGGAEPEEEFDASHILVETEDEAKDLVTALDGGADFAELAMEKSTGPSGPNGGALGWFGKGMMVPAFEEAVLGMDVDQVSAPIETQFGWHVIKLNDKRQKEAPALDAVRDQITDQLRRNAVEKAVADMSATAEIERIEAGSIDPELLNDLSLIRD
jgi:peptidyl-prolyl cis-trans isomerase C